MRILFRNCLLENAGSITSLYESPNYPAENIINPMLRIRYQSLLASDTLTATLTEPCQINCLFFGYVNATVIDVRLYLSNVLQYSGSVDIPAGENVSATHYFATVTADKIEVDMTGLYIGGIGAGLYRQMPDPAGNFGEGWIDNSTITASPYGQGLVNYIEPQRTGSFRFLDVRREEYLAICDDYRATGKYNPVWVDFFERNHDFKAPGYFRMSDPVQREKNGRRYDMSIAFEEAR